MQPQIIQSAEKLMTQPGILGAVIFRKEILLYHKTDPRFNPEQLRSLGHHLHELFSGYLNVQRHISEVSLQFNGTFLSVSMLKEKEDPLYIATLAENLASLSRALEQTRQWAVNDLIWKPKRTSKITSKLRPTAHILWGRFLTRLRDCLDKSLGPESGSIVLTRALEHFHVGSSEPLPNEQWLAFVAEVGNQIPNPDARVRFYKFYSEAEIPQVS